MNKALVDGMQYSNFADGAVIALLSIVMVFVVLVVIIVLTELISKLAGKDNETKEKTTSTQTVASAPASPLNINDEDAMVACLIASIDYRNETKKNIQVISVKEG